MELLHKAWCCHLGRGMLQFPIAVLVLMVGNVRQYILQACASIYVFIYIISRPTFQWSP
jgi:hypothetical protein